MRFAQQNELRKWISILESTVQDGIAATPNEPFSDAAKGLLAGRSGGVSVNDRRREISLLLAYVNEPSSESADLHRLMQMTAAMIPSVNAQPETAWYTRLVVLHAHASYAALSGDAQANDAMRKMAQHVHEEIQPDHATALPWGIHGFALTPGCETTSEMILNACMIQYAGEPHGAALVLLADALYCLRHVADF